MSPSSDDEFIGASRTGRLRFISIPTPMNNHVHRHGLLPKKSPDGSREIRRTFRHLEDLESSSLHRSSDGGVGASTAPILLSHSGEKVRQLVCGFDHGALPVTYKPHTLPNHYDARMNRAQLRELAQNCEFCKVLLTGIDGFRTLWYSQLEKRRYQDNVYDHRLELEDDEYWNLLNAAGDYDFDERFMPEPVRNDEIPVYIEYIAQDPGLRVRIQRNPHPDFERMETLCTLDFLVAKGTPSPWESIRSRPAVVQNLLSYQGFARLQSWVDNCIDNHDLCNFYHDQIRPTRLVKINIDDTDDPSLLRLVYSADEPNSGRYIALSHSWATSHPLRTTWKNYEQHRRDIPYGPLSPVYDDTFRLAIYLGVNYVWIDSLCIIQNDVADWEKEAPRMASVYSNAYIVFAALGPSLALEKIAPMKIPMSTQTAGDQIVEQSCEIQVNLRINHDNFINSANDESAGMWFTRAWCFQERLFASRILHLGGSMEEVTFECNTGITCECEGFQRRSHGRGEAHVSSAWCHIKAQYARLFHKLTTGAWESESISEFLVMADDFLIVYIALCEDFTAKQLTYPNDALPAMAGLEQSLMPYLGSYCAGLWKHRILIQLQWESFDGSQSRRIEDCQAPTFSWASRTGGAIWYFDPNEMFREIDRCTFATVLESQLKDTSASYHEVRTDSLVRLRGRARTLYVSHQESGEGGTLRLSLNSEQRRQTSDADTSTALNEAMEDEEVEHSAYVQMDTQDDIEEILLLASVQVCSVTCFELMCNGSHEKEDKRFSSALVLIPGSQRNTYRRVGFAILEYGMFEHSSGSIDVPLV